MWRRPCPSNNPGDHGRASLEFLVAGVLLFVPVMVGSLVLMTLQTASLASNAAARHAVRVFTQSTSLEIATTRTTQAAANALGQFGIDEDYSLQVQCVPQGQCLRPGSWVEVTVTTEVSLGRLPGLPTQSPLQVPIDATAAAQVSPYRGIP